MPKTKASLYVIAATLCTVIVLFVLPITPKVPVSTAPIVRGNLVRTLALEGMVGYADTQVCLSPVEGRISQVYAKQGESVRRGDVLVRLDTTMEERALSGLREALYRQEAAVGALDAQWDAVQAVWLQNQLSLEQRMQELSLTIEAKTVRASADGVVGQVYGVEDAYVAAFSPLMSLHGDGLELSAQARVQDTAPLEAGMRAVIYEDGRQRAVAVLEGFDAPDADSLSGSLTQTLRFSVEEGGEWLRERIGETVAMEIIWDVQSDMALAPMAAVSQGNQLWVVREGRVSSVSVDPRRRDAEYVSVPEALVGETVVLLPDDAALYQGCLVKEAKK